MTIKSLTAGSWQTKSAGIVTILTALATLWLNRNNGGLGNQDAMISAAVAQIVAGLGLLGARQNNKTSEEVGAGQQAAIAKKQAALDAAKAQLTKPPTPPTA